MSGKIIYRNSMDDMDSKKVDIASGAACWPVAGKTFSLHGLMSRPTDNLWVEGIDHRVSTEDIPAKATDAWSPFHKAYSSESIYKTKKYSHEK